MKLRLLFTVIIILFNNISVIAQCPAGTPPSGYTCIPDTNFEQALIDLMIDSEGNLDGQVLTADINSVTTLGVSSKSISDLTGIEDFSNLVRLVCNGNSITNLDLTNNLNLEELLCHFNAGLTTLLLPNTNKITYLDLYNCALTNIDLTPYTELDLLRTYNNPSLGSLDLTNNTKLRYLYCYNNGLTNLDVSNNTLLEILDCYQNDLTSLDVSNNNALTRLWCHQNELTAIDITQNTLLTSFYCHLNQITSLDASQNTLLDRLWCYSNQLNSLLLPVTNTLTYLRCYTNNLTSLDVSGLTGLDRFDCGLNSITSLDVSMITTLTELYCNGNQLTYLNLQNGANSTLDWMWAQNNSSLTCIQVDNVAQAQTKPNWDEDDPSYYSTSCSLSTNDFLKESILVYPNPTNSLLNIKLEIEANYSIINILGKDVLKGNLLTGENQLNLSSISDGIYYLQIRSTEGRVTKKIVKE